MILGPESVGKTTLCNQLQTQLDALVVPNISRSYLKKLERPYNYDDVEAIAKEQVASFKKLIADNPSQEFLLVDTYLVVTKVWFLYVYNRCPKWLQEEILGSQIDLYLLLKPDIEWEEDAFRETPHVREYLYDLYKKELDALDVNYVEIEGVGAIRAKRAMRAINRLRNVN